MRGGSMTPETARDAAPYSRTLRRLHLAIACFVVLLAGTGFSIYFRKPLGLQDLKLTLTFAHAVLAYAFLVILAVRLYLGVWGAEAMRLRRTLPRHEDFRRLFSTSGARDRRFALAGRSPLSRTIAAVLYVAFATNAATGLVRAGTDLYFPPFGPIVRAYVAGDGVDLARLKPGDASGADETRLKKISRAKIPFGRVHIYGAFVIAGFALFHSVGVGLTEWSAPNARKARGRARLMLFGPRRA